MKIFKTILDDLNGEVITQIRLINNHGIEASFITLGATWQSFLVPRAEGGHKNLVLGFDQPEDYQNTGFCAGQSVGRVAGRIGKGHAEVNGKVYQLPINNNANCLHGGPNGLHTKNWSFETFEEQSVVGVRFTYRAKAEDDQFPGDMTVSATYTLDDENQLTVTYKGYDVTEHTLFNPTNHVYFNLGDSQDLKNHHFQVPANHILEVDDELIPSGVLLDVTDTAYDFRQGKNLSLAIEQTGGIDDTFIVAPSLETPIAILTEEVSGDSVSIYSDRNALVVYTLNFPEEGAKFAKDGGAENQKHQGVALEAQFPPNAINHPHLADIVLQKGEERSYTIRYHYQSQS
ncbi:aldose epimerase family protein [Streptococcus fryi]